jgi:adenosyl cobinamide kinase/adenosyl cobinamide phosphate guanylyltransferase
VVAVKTLILGGARSGKSLVAERLASRATGPVTYVATVRVGDDADLAARVDEHRRRRPGEWTTLECGDDLATVLASTPGTMLVDSLGPWLADLMDQGDLVGALCEAIAARQGDTIIVSDEVGLSVHPETHLGRKFRDALGTLNQRVAQVSDDVLLVVAGRVITLAKDEGV